MPQFLTGRDSVRAGLLTLILLTCALVASTWHFFGHTWDEPEHIAAGMSLIDHGQYEYDLQHPPLGRIMFALAPYLAGARSHGFQPPDGKPEGLEILYDGGHYDRYLTLARLGALPFLVLLLVVTWLWARRLMPETAALLAVGLVVTVPPLLGHAGLAALDVPAAATCLAALYAAQRWLEIGGWRRAMGFGLFAGAAIATKLSAIPFLALGVLLFAVVRLVSGAAPAAADRPRDEHHRWIGAMLATFVATVVIIMAYGGQIVYLTDATHRFDQALWYLFGDAGPAHDAAYAFFARVPMPEAFELLLNGVEALQIHNQGGHLSFLLGELHSRGWWYFYPVALAVKTPLPLLVLGLAGLAWQALRGWRARDLWLLGPPVVFLGLLVFCCAVSRINIGVRHVLILYPLLAIGAAYSVACVWASTEGSWYRQMAARTGLVLMLVWQSSALIAAYPDYLPWFNETVRAPEEVLVDSDLDWGQDLRRLEHRLAELRVTDIALAYSGSADLSREPLPRYKVLQPGKSSQGWIAIFALAKVRGAGGYAWLDEHVPRERIGKTVDLYYIQAPSPGPTP